MNLYNPFISISTSTYVYIFIYIYTYMHVHTCRSFSLPLRLFASLCLPLPHSPSLPFSISCSLSLSIPLSRALSLPPNSSPVYMFTFKNLMVLPKQSCGSVPIARPDMFCSDLFGIKDPCSKRNLTPDSSRLVLSKLCYLLFGGPGCMHKTPFMNCGALSLLEALEDSIAPVCCLHYLLQGSLKQSVHWPLRLSWAWAPLSASLESTKLRKIPCHHRVLA